LSQEHRVAVEAAIGVAEQFARGRADNADVTRATAGATGWVDAADFAATDAARAATEAARAAGWAAAGDARWAAAIDAAAAAHSAATAAGRAAADDVAFVAAAADISRLLELKLGKPRTLGTPIDPSESGPLGPLWPDGEPEWNRKPSTPIAEIEFAPSPNSQPPYSLVIAWDPDVLNPDEYAQLVKSLGDLARAEGAAGVLRLRSRGYGIPCEAGVPR
jgi:hypothetical protein